MHCECTAYRWLHLAVIDGSEWRVARVSVACEFVVDASLLSKSRTYVERNGPVQLELIIRPSCCGC